ncbi:hypothetical protein [Nocardia wallacei]|uniref:hypothetical protein n=1 Tax=Nocardia wallacei TaxID=480035 RepID=UPI002455F872|nr:hypothetical protein [Nocardia wallacei]
MTSRRPVNKVSNRLRPSDRTSVTMQRAVRRPVDRSPREGRSDRKSAADRSVSGTRRSTADRSSGAGSSAGDRRPSFRWPDARALRSSWSLAAALLVAAVLLSGFAAVAAFRPGVADGNDAYVDTRATQEVTAAADHALKTLYSYDVKTIGGYKDAVHGVVTGKMLADFDKFADTTVSAIQQAQSTAQATADPIGVTLLTDDRAELLVNLTVSATKNDVPQESASGPIVLRMEKLDGHWLASEIADR